MTVRAVAIARPSARRRRPASRRRLRTAMTAVPARIVVDKVTGARTTTIPAASRSGAAMGVRPPRRTRPVGILSCRWNGGATTVAAASSNAAVTIGLTARPVSPATRPTAPSRPAGPGPHATPRPRRRVPTDHGAAARSRRAVDPRTAADVEHDLDRGGQLAVQGAPVHSTEGGQRLQSGGHLGRAVGMNRSGAPVMPGVQRRQQVDHLRASDLADDDAVRTHAQRLPDQLAQRDLPGALDVGAARHQPNQVGMLRLQFRGVLHTEDPFALVHRPECSGQQGGLARPGAARDQEGQPRGDDGAQQPCRFGRYRAGGRQRGQILRGRPQYPK